MPGWFRPKCPLDSHAKEWVESRLIWLSNEFGTDVFTRRAIILPLQEFFPDEYDGSYESLRSLLDRICLYMDADSSRVHLELFKSPELWLINEQGHGVGGIAGLYEEHSNMVVIHIDVSQIGYPMELVGTMAHELSHLRLLGEGRVDSEIYDNELLTDLTVVFHGLGIFLANIPRAWMSDYTTWPDSNSPKPEYMTQFMYGYALAHSAWFRKERKPAWAKHLRPDARASFKQSLKYLWATGDSKFKPDHAQ